MVIPLTQKIPQAINSLTDITQQLMNHSGWLFSQCSVRGIPIELPKTECLTDMPRDDYFFVRQVSDSACELKYFLVGPGRQAKGVHCPFE